ncbi:M28 family peptidase [bacterium]
MKKLALIGLLLVIMMSALHAQVTVPKAGMKAISAEEFKSHLEYMASDEMRGRNTPSPELDTCAAYIARYFHANNLKPAGEDGSYYQYFNVMKSSLSEPNSLKLITDAGETVFEIKNDFVPIHITANRSVTAPVVFAGYGITAPEYDYDDYSDIDADGKIVFVFTHEPQEKDSSSVFDGTKMTDYSKLLEKAINARKHGAVGMLVVTDPNNHRFRRPPNVWPSLLRRPPKDAIPLVVEEKMENKVVAMRLGKDLADAVFEKTGKIMSELQTAIDSTLTPQSFQIPGLTVTMETNLTYDKTQTQNVVGLLEGRDSKLKDEVIVIGAHYDHVGATSDTTIFNGADDNASGTVGVMTLAKALSACPQRPRRSILFCAWAGEEKGLFGSRYYVDTAPLFPLENTVTCVNFDMIGRNDSSKVQVSGFTSSNDIKRVTLEANKSIGIEIDSSKAISRTDHVSFYRKEIPVLGFMTGFHPDYHQITDTADKCFPEGCAQICRLVYRIVWSLAEEDQRPKYKPPKK